MALVERKLEIVDWKERGKIIDGHLLSAKVTKFNDGGTGMSYLLRRKDGSMVAFRGATQLDMLITRNDVGARVQIEYLGEDQTRVMAEGRSKPKLFKVAVDVGDQFNQPAPTQPDYAAQGITDDDIPF